MEDDALSTTVSTKSMLNSTKNTTIESEKKARSKTTSRRRQSSTKRPISDSDSDSTLASLNLKKGRRISPRNASLRSNNSSTVSLRSKPKPVIKDVVSESSSEDINITKSPVKQSSLDILNDNDVDVISYASEDSDSASSKSKIKYENI